MATKKSSTGVDVLLHENRVFKPSKKIIDNSNVMKWMKEHKIKDYDELLKKSQNLEWFWNEAAKEIVEWYKEPKNILKWKAPYAEWFSGAKYNIAHDALDKHIRDGKKDKVAYYFEGEPGDTKKITYGQLYKEVNKMANALTELKVKKGDRVEIYMPMIPQLPIAMLACAKIGAIHSVVFSGFSAAALRTRVKDSRPKVLFTCDSYYRRGKKIILKDHVDEALEGIKSLKKVIVVKRTGKKTIWNKDRDLWWHQLLKGQSTEFKTKKMDPNDPLYLLYTSGTTGKPKGIIHSHGDYAVSIGLTLKWVFDLKEDDIWWCAADIGWVTGHSYIVYAPLILGVTSVIYEGVPTYPNPDRWWQIIDKYKVSVLYTSPTAVRLFMRTGTKWVKKHSLKSLRLLGSVGEPINPEAWMWYYKNIGKSRCPIMDTWWQTEIGSFCISPLPITSLKPGSATKPFPGMDADIFNDKGKSVKGKGGHLVIKNPWPGMPKGIYKNPQRYKKTYWNKFKGVYLAGDVARKDKEGYFWIQGREDDVLNVAGHRIGNSEVESALVSHHKVAEAAVIGKPHELKGECIVAFVVLKKGVKITDILRAELRNHVGDEISKIARPDELLFVTDVPKTRSGKIMRRVIRNKVLGKSVGDISTLSNPGAVEEISQAK